MCVKGTWTLEQRSGLVWWRNPVYQLECLLSCFVTFVILLPPWFSWFLSAPKKNTQTKNRKHTSLTIVQRLVRPDCIIPRCWQPSCLPLRPDSAYGGPGSGSAGPERSAGLSRWRHVWGQKHLLQGCCGHIRMLPAASRELPCWVHETSWNIWTGNEQPIKQHTFS